MSTHDEVAALLADAARVVVVPGYGVAAAQAQHDLRALVDALVDRGTEVAYVVHPVAGRVPAHLNAVLDAAGVPHDSVRGLDEGDDALDRADVALVVGAGDVVNPALEVPVVEVGRARRVVVLRRTTGPGYAGLDNALLHDPATTVLLGELGPILRRLRTTTASAAPRRT